MAKLTIEQLNNTAKELDDLMALDPAPPKDGSKEEIETWIKEAAEELQPQDVISEETQSILEALGVWIAPENREEFEDETEEPDLIKELDEAENLKDLKALVKSYDEFKSLRGTITKYKAGDEEDLKEEMFFLLEPEKPETKVVKMTPSGRKEVPIPKKKEKKLVVKETKSAVKKKDGQIPMATFIDNVLLKGGFWDDMIDVCKEEAEERGYKPDINKGALNNHIKIRLKKNPEWLGELEITDEGLV